MTRQYGSKLIVLTVLAASTGGCSWIFVDGPPPDHADLDYFTCTPSRVAPRLDVVGAGLNVLAALVVAASDADFNYYGGNSIRETLILGYLGQAAIYGFSARSGFSRVNACNEALRLRGERNEDPDTLADGPTDRTPGDATGSRHKPAFGPARRLPVPSWAPPNLVPVNRPGS